MKQREKSLTKGELTRERIVTAAIRLFGRRGFDIATLDEIAKASRTQRSGIINYYGSKERLLAACITRILDQLKNDVETEALSTRTATDLLDRNFEWNLKFVLTHRNEGQVILLFYTLAAHSKELGHDYETINASITRKYQQYLMQGVRSKEFMFSEDPSLIAQLIREYTLGTIVHLLALRNPEAHIAESKKRWKVFRARLLSLK